MKKTGVKIATGMMFAGALAMTSFTGAAVTENAYLATAEKTETVEYKVEENESSLTDCGEWNGLGSHTSQYSFEDEIKSSGYGVKYAYIKVDGCDKDVLAETTWFRDEATIAGYSFANYQGIIDAGNGVYQVNFYTQSDDGEIIHAGYVLTDKNYPVKYKDGIIYAPNAHSYETYILSDNGRELVHKDYFSDKDYWGYTNETNKESNRDEKVITKEEYDKLWENYYNADEIDFSLYEYQFGEKDSSLTRCGNANRLGFLTGYTDFQDCINQLNSQHCRYAKGDIRGYKGEVLIVQPTGDHNCVCFFTKKNGENVRLAGFLYTDGKYEVKIGDNGVIYAPNGRSYETYMLTPDGKELVHKDYVDNTNWGYTNESADQSKKVDFSGSFNDAKLWDNYNNASEIDYNITSWN